MITIVLGSLLYACGLAILDRSLQLSVQTSMLYDFSVFGSGCVLIVVGVYFSALHGVAKKIVF
jgi:hypothetical protein